jgi:hypothetical protein
MNIGIPQEGTTMSNAANAALAEPWKDLWNGDLSLTPKIIAEDFVAHVIEVGRITDEEHLVVRWKARGTYRGGFPSAAPEAAGREVTFTGTDTLRVADRQFAEYWANATACCSTSNSASEKCLFSYPRGQS